MRAGLLREEIVLQQRTDTVDSFGQPIPVWSNLDTEWAAAEPERGREFFVAQQLQAVEPIRFRLRYRADVTASMRVLWRGKIYDIKTPPVDFFGRERELHLYCDTGLTQG